MLVLVFKREFFLSRLQNVLDTWQTNKMACVSKEDSDQAGQPKTNQTGRMPRLIWVFAGRTNHFVGFVMERLILCRLSKLSNQSYIMFKEQKQYPKSTHCMLLFRLVLFAEPCLTILRWLEKRQELYWTTGDVPGRCLVVTTFEIVYCQLLFIPTSSIWFWHREFVYQNT